jgi:hypothetical protein
LVITQCDVATPRALAAVRIGPKGLFHPASARFIPPECGFFVDIERGSLVLRKHPENELIVSKMVGGSALEVTSDGLFLSVVFLNGKIAVFEIVHKDKVPIDLELVRQIPLYREATCSAVLSQDFLVAVACPDAVIVSNFATGFLHRMMPCDTPPIGLLYDDFEGNLTVLHNRSLIQYSVNGEKLHHLSFPRDVVCACLIPYCPRFDGRFVVVGHEDGSLSFCIVNDGFELCVLFSKRMHLKTCTSLYYDATARVLWSCDAMGIVFSTAFPTDQVVVTCSHCQIVTSQKCKKCQTSLCGNCIGSCPICKPSGH